MNTAITLGRLLNLIGKNDPSSFAVFLGSYLDQIWSSLSQLDEIDRQRITAKVKKEIVEKLQSIEM